MSSSASEASDRSPSSDSASRCKEQAAGAISSRKRRHRATSLEARSRTEDQDEDQVMETRSSIDPSSSNVEEESDCEADAKLNDEQPQKKRRKSKSAHQSRSEGKDKDKSKSKSKSTDMDPAASATEQGCSQHCKHSARWDNQKIHLAAFDEFIRHCNVLPDGFEMESRGEPPLPLPMHAELAFQEMPVDFIDLLTGKQLWKAYEAFIKNLPYQAKTQLATRPMIDEMVVTGNVYAVLDRAHEFIGASEKKQFGCKLYDQRVQEQLRKLCPTRLTRGIFRQCAAIRFCIKKPSNLIHFRVPNWMDYCVREESHSDAESI